MKIILAQIKKLISKRYILFVILFLIIAGFIIYSNTFRAEYQLDDGIHILFNDDIKDPGNFAAINKWTEISERPLSKFTLALNFSLHQYDVFGYHLVNIIIHILTSCFVFLIILEILKSPVFNDQQPQKNHTIIAFFCALIFLAHPIQTQSVTYIVQRMTSLAGLLYLMSVYFYIKGRYFHIQHRKTSIIWYILAIFAGIAAFLSKQNAITFLLAWLLIELFFIRNKNNKLYKTYLISGFAIIILGITGALFWKGLPYETSEISRAEYLITQFRVIIKYIQLSVIPIQQNLDYDFSVSTTIWGVKELLSLGVIILLVGLAIFSFKNYRLFSFGIFWFFLTLSVESSIIPIEDVIFEHRLYIPVIGIILILVYGLFLILSRKKISFFILAMMVITLLFGILTYTRNEVWKTNYSLWKDTYEKSPDKARPNLNYGIAKLEQGDYRGAFELLTRTIKIDPRNMKAYFNRGNVRSYFKDYQGAIEDISIFISEHPDFADAYDGLGKAKLHSGDFSGAINAFNKAIEIDSFHDKAHFNRGTAKMFLQDYQGAILDFNKSMELNSSNPATYNFIGQSYVYMDRKKEAMEHFTKAIEVDPTYAMAYFNRAYLHMGQNHVDEGFNDFNKAIELNPNIILAYKGRGLIYYWRGKYELAYRDLMHAQNSGAEIPQGLLKEIELLLLKQTD